MIGTRNPLVSSQPVEHWVTAIPVYSDSFNEREEARLRFSAPFLGNNVVILAPKNLDASAFVSVLGQARVEYFEERWFQSREAYSALMLSPVLYDRFRESDVMMVYQLDAIVRREIPRSMFFGLDYLGAPWNPPFSLRWNPFRGELLPGGGLGFRRELSVGNGGLSLRRIAAFRRAAWLVPRVSNRINEDLIFSYFAPFVGIRVAGRDHARKVFMETEARDWTQGQPVPEVFGFHALGKHNAELEEALLGGFP